MTLERFVRELSLWTVATLWGVLGGVILGALIGLIEILPALLKD